MAEEKDGTASEGLAGVRADFVASLGRKVADARKTLAALEGDPRASAPRDELRRKLHALGTSARMMRFEAMAQALAEAEAALETLDPGNAASLRNVTVVARALDDLPALAWSDARRAEPVPPPPNGPKSVPPSKDVPPPTQETARVEAPSGATPMMVLVVGPESIADALLDAEEHRAIECERSDDPHQAIRLARAVAPDVVVIDAQVPQAAELVEALSDDPLTEPVPVVIVGKFDAQAQARFVALGVARTLTAPYSGDALRGICEEAVDQRDGRTMRISLGEPTIEQLGERLADEVRRALVGAVDMQSRNKRVALGEGTEVMAAIWGAISRVREVVSTRTGGAVRFAGSGPEGASALAFQPDVPGADRVRRGRGAAADVTLEGRRVVVADDDPGVTWFLADLLRTTGCIVHEALDGSTALDLAMRTSPDVIISDILMPKMDGFALSRAIKRDVALRDTPVILLSWKEDLLQRVRELGASAAAYLRKESDARSVLARVREVLWPRARVEARLKGNGEVRGRLDGLTVRSLLEFVAAQRADARVSVRDASCLYEIEMRDGAPRRATRSASDGDFARGPKVLRELIGVTAGRFVVAPATPGALQSELTGTLSQQLEKHIAAARGAIATTSGPQATRVARLELDADVLHHYLRATPEPARSLIVRISKGASPRALLLEGQVVPSLLDDVLTDLAARGIVIGVTDEEGRDVLEPAIESALAVIRGAPARSTTPLSPIRPSMTPPPVIAKSAHSDGDFEESSVNVSIDQILAEQEAKALAEKEKTQAKPAPPVAPVAPPAPQIKEVSKRAEIETSLNVSVQQLLDEEARILAEERRSSQTPGVGGSLEDAVMQKLGENSPAPAGAHTSSPIPPPMIEPSVLKRRSSNPPNDEAPLDKTDIEGADVSKLATPTVPHLAPPPALELVDQPEESAKPAPAKPAVLPSGPKSEKPKAEAKPESKKPAPKEETTAPVSKREPVSVSIPQVPPKETGSGTIRWLAITAVLAVATFVAVKVSVAPAPAEPTPPASQATEPPINVLYTDIPPGASVGENEGYLEIHAPDGTAVLVDGAEHPAGSIAAGPHELQANGRTKSVDVRAGKTARVDWP
ncbi:MAG TPA: response regulator [Polyangiaceae bacterium]|jgi:CheY-like chemotaxis protein|nr:response regulator [Polyangiaceae bacterium]